MSETTLDPSDTLEPADIRAAAALHTRAFPHFFLSSLGERFLREFYSGFLSDPDAVTAVTRTANGRILGVAVGTLTPDRFFRRLLRTRGLRFALAGLPAALRRPRTALRLLRAIAYRGTVPVGAEGALLSSICVDPTAQHAGHGRWLIEAWWLRARERGARSAYLITDRVDNEAVNNFYRRAGWTPRGSYTTPEGRPMNCYVVADHTAGGPGATSGPRPPACRPESS
ncbi:GNAT family N-acetyltransferase [Plantactinospora sp. GCM10030261]|uniref:GNAT family N-acetyltransferase n=1 Tax=Plantactinospora sp. GCM10030261 TaxID=3273420 RepID=UPI003615F786